MSGTITLADGTVIDTMTGKPHRANGVATGFTVIPSSAEAVREVTRVRKRLADLPEVPEKMNIIAVISAYYLFGLEDFEIAHATGLTERQVGNIKMTSGFTDMIGALQKNMMDGQADDVRSIISEGARKAAQRMISSIDSGNEQAAIVAAKDVLDRAGHRPNDIVEHRHSIDGGLTIEYVKKSVAEDLPKINLTIKEDDDA